MHKLIIILLLMLPFVMDAQMTYVPDDNFEQALIDLGYDTPPLDNYVPTRNINKVKALLVTSERITSLTGIEDFIDLEYLYCSYNDLTVLDISKNLALKELYCISNWLTSLNISKNIALQKLKCSINQLKSLDISKNPLLNELDCSLNELSNLNTSENPLLEVLSCRWNQLWSLDLSTSTSLKSLDCAVNNLSNLNVSTNITLNMLSCSANRISNLDVSQNTALETLYCEQNKLTNLDVSKNHALKVLICYGNLLINLDIKNGNNKNMFDKLGNYFDATNNPDLRCIQVDDSAYSANNPKWLKDPTAHYSEDCNYTGIDDLKFEDKSVSISPNPAADYIEIELSDNHTLKGVVECIIIYNVLGEMVSGSDTPPNPLFLEGRKHRLDIFGLPPGVYFVRAGNSVQRFIKY